MPHSVLVDSEEKSSATLFTSLLSVSSVGVFQLKPLSVLRAVEDSFTVVANSAVLTSLKGSKVSSAGLDALSSHEGPSKGTSTVRPRTDFHLTSFQNPEAISAMSVSSLKLSQSDSAELVTSRGMRLSVVNSPEQVSSATLVASRLVSVTAAVVLEVAPSSVLRSVAIAASSTVMTSMMENTVTSRGLDVWSYEPQSKTTSTVQPMTDFHLMSFGNAETIIYPSLSVSTLVLPQPKSADLGTLTSTSYSVVNGSEHESSTALVASHLLRVTASGALQAAPSSVVSAVDSSVTMVTNSSVTTETKATSTGLGTLSS